MTDRLPKQLQTGIGRLIDVEHRSNRYAIAATLVAGAGAVIWRWATEADDIWLWALYSAAAVFLAWATGRELDPDDSTSAGTATVLVIPLLALGAPSLASSVAVLVAMRIAVKTTGISPRLIDGVVLTLGAAYLGAQAESWPALGVLVLAVGTDRYAHPPGPMRTLWFAGAMILAAFLTAIFFADPADWVQPTIPEWLVVGAVGLLGFLAIVNTQPPRSTADYHPGDLSESRLRFGRVLALFALVVAIVYVGGPGVADLTPLWAAVAGVTFVHYYRLLAARRIG